MTTTSSSITIQRELEAHGGEIVETVGEGDATMTLFRLGYGRLVIETNGDPVWEGDEGFEQLIRTHFGGRRPQRERDGCYW